MDSYRRPPGRIRYLHYRVPSPILDHHTVTGYELGTYRLLGRWFDGGSGNRCEPLLSARHRCYLHFVKPRRHVEVDLRARENLVRARLIG